MLGFLAGYLILLTLGCLAAVGCRVVFRVRRLPAIRRTAGTFAAMHIVICCIAGLQLGAVLILALMRAVDDPVTHTVGRVFVLALTFCVAICGTYLCERLFVGRLESQRVGRAMLAVHTRDVRRYGWTARVLWLPGFGRLLIARLLRRR